MHAALARAKGAEQVWKEANGAVWRSNLVAQSIYMERTFGLLVDDVFRRGASEAARIDISEGKRDQ